MNVLNNGIRNTSEILFQVCKQRQECYDTRQLSMTPSPDMRELCKYCVKVVGKALKTTALARKNEETFSVTARLVAKNDYRFQRP